jgi:hypothetical protein
MKRRRKIEVGTVGLENAWGIRRFIEGNILFDMFFVLAF